MDPTIDQPAGKTKRRTGKHSDATYIQRSVYLKVQTHNRVKAALAEAHITGARQTSELSELVESLLSAWLRDITPQTKEFNVGRDVISAICAGTTHKKLDNRRPDATLYFTAFGETKHWKDWHADYRCVVKDEETLRWRMCVEGIDPETAITKPVDRGANNPRTYLLEAFGETKTLRQWSEDSRCIVPYPTLNSRAIRNGIPLEVAMTTPASSPVLEITLFGETKSVKAWSRDPRCIVSDVTLKKRILAGVDPETMFTL